MTIRQALQGAGFKAHNNKSSELVASKFHSSIRNVRIVASTGVCKKTGKDLTANAHASFKAVYINKQSQWRTIASGAAFKGAKSLDFNLKAIELAAAKAPTCKCGAKKFKAKSGNVVCADACWTAWSGKKKWQGTKKKNTSQPTQQRRTSAKKIPQIKKEAVKPIEGTYTVFVPGQLVKIVEAQQDTLSGFIGTVTKVQPVGDDQKRPLADVWVLWMHTGATERHNNYRANELSHPGTYLVPVA